MIESEPLPTGPARDVRMAERTQSVGHGDSRAKIDTAALRLQRLGAILEQHDADALREWRLSQLAQLGITSHA